MPKLKVLPANLANMIAAGEVVQRPASVVKELMENSVDAGATLITVNVTDSGRTLIQVIDNGCGMSPEDALLCFERHATSKIASQEDLEAINTYGFRGEALPSIAAVSEVTLKTKRPEDELATKVETGPSGTATSNISAPQGSSFAIRNLFFNTPARRKFLKSDAVELKHIVEEFTRIALTRYQIGFTLISNGKEIYVLKPAKTEKFRVMDLMGASIASDLVDISASTSTVGIEGFIGSPQSAKKTTGSQFFFVNGRFFRSAYFNKAILKAYEGFIPEGVTPSYFLNLTINPDAIDVNIHPTKTEIKFEDDSVIFQIIFACVKETLGKNAFGASIDFEAATAVDMPSFGKHFDQYHSVSQPQESFDPEYNPFDETPNGGGSPKYENFPGPSALRFDNEDYGRLFEEKSLPSTKCLVLGGKYIVSESADGMMVVNIRRAHERVLYESFLHTVGSGLSPRQETLFPVNVEVGVMDRLTIEGSAEELRTMGFEIEPCSEGCITVKAVPEGFSCEEKEIRSMISNLIFILSEGTGGIKQMMDSARAQKYALLGASCSRRVTSPLEAQSLMDRLLSCENPELTPSGHRILTIITNTEIEKKLQ